MVNILSIGAGVMGTAITVPASINGHSITLVGTHLDTEIINSIQKTGIHPVLNVKLEKTIAKQIDDLQQSDFDQADVIVIGISSAGVNWFIELLSKFQADNKKFLIITKGLYVNDQNTIDILPNKILRSIPYHIDITAVAGPCKAIELAQKYITNICFINQNTQIANELARIFKNDFYIIEVLSDFIGGEFCAALKNVFAIMVGCSQTCYNPKAKIFNPESGIFTHCIQELAQIVKLHEGDIFSAFGLPGIGDLHVTSGTGRNGTLGKYLGEGKVYSEIMAKELKDQTVEGAQLIIDLQSALKEKFNNGFFSKEQLPIFYELVQAISADKKLHIPWNKL
jgi:glycerol-3-phosphate dehydrogenase (NAD(P)+)